MAYSLGHRFPSSPKYYTLLDPGAYETIVNVKTKVNSAPFLIKSPRNLMPANKIWTDVIYSANTPRKIPNCSSMMSKLPRFPYKTFSEEDLDEILCKCGIENTCECEYANEISQKNEICQAQVQKRIFIGPPPRSITEGGLSVPSKGDRGFKIYSNGAKKRMLSKPKEESPPFRDITVYEHTTYYQGCKWSRRSSKRAFEAFDDKPGPTNYTITQKSTQTDSCIEKIREHRRKISKQYRFIEMVQQKNYKDNYPGPAAYDPKLPKETELQNLGPKADRFKAIYGSDIPGPSHYRIKRSFELPEPLTKHCLASLPEQAPFGVKAKRFKTIQSDGPSPASYNTNYKSCKFLHCPSAPFGSSALRFKETKSESDSESDENLDIDLKPNDHECVDSRLTWMFKSKSERIKPLIKKLAEPSPADLPQSKLETKIRVKSKSVTPFFSSEPRFQPWHNWISVNNTETPGPGKYDIQKLSCVHPLGPLYRSARFKFDVSQVPACNEYKINGGIEKILHTHNKRLKDNVLNKHKFQWNPPGVRKKLSKDEKESLLINKCIAILNTNIFVDSNCSNDNKNNITFNHKNSRVKKEKMLRCFLYNNVMPKYF